MASLRERTGKTQIQVAIEVGVTPQTIGAWERGAVPHLDKAIRLAQALELTIEELCDAFGLDLHKNKDS